MNALKTIPMTTAEIISSMKADASLLVSLRNGIKNARSYIASARGCLSVDTIVCLANGELWTIRVTEDEWTKVRSYGKI